MSEQADEAKGGAPDRPTPAREGGQAGASPPTPVRASLGSPTPPAGAPPTETLAAPEATRLVDAGGREWTVRALGASSAGPATSSVPLLLVGFFADPDADEPAREALVVGVTLEALTHDELVAAFRASRPPRPAGARAPLFPEITTRGNRRDG